MSVILAWLRLTGLRRLINDSLVGPISPQLIETLLGDTRLPSNGHEGRDNFRIPTRFPMMKANLERRCSHSDLVSRRCERFHVLCPEGFPQLFKFSA
jgi:hypothetical protein